jgi:hypothetical protein
MPSLKRPLSTRDSAFGSSPWIGSGAGDCAPAPSHTTGRAVFRIRRLASREFFRRPLAAATISNPRLLPWPVARQTGMRNRSVTFRCFIRMFVDSPELNLAPSIPSALRYSRLSPGFIATTASADFPRPLSPGISLGQCRPCPLTPSGSTVIVDDSWASLVLACSPPMTGLAASSCSYGRRFASSPFAPVPYGSSLAVRLRLLSSPRRGPFTPRGSAPARRTRDGFHPVPDLIFVTNVVFNAWGY